VQFGDLVIMYQFTILISVGLLRGIGVQKIFKFLIVKNDRLSG